MIRILVDQLLVDKLVLVHADGALRLCNMDLSDVSQTLQLPNTECVSCLVLMWTNFALLDASFRLQLSNPRDPLTLLLPILYHNFSRPANVEWAQAIGLKDTGAVLILVLQSNKPRGKASSSPSSSSAGQTENISHRLVVYLITPWHNHPSQKKRKRESDQQRNNNTDDRTTKLNDIVEEQELSWKASHEIVRHGTAVGFTSPFSQQQRVEKGSTNIVTCAFDPHHLTFTSLCIVLFLMPYISISYHPFHTIYITYMYMIEGWLYNTWYTYILVIIFEGSDGTMEVLRFPTLQALLGEEGLSYQLQCSVKLANLELHQVRYTYTIYIYITSKSCNLYIYITTASSTCIHVPSIIFRIGNKATNWIQQGPKDLR